MLFFRILVAASIVVSGACAQSTKLSSPLISADSIKRHVYVLGDDSLEGRGTGTRGCAKAADYIRSCLRSYGIRPPAKFPNYFQSFPLHGSTPLGGTQLMLLSSEKEHSLRLQEDYLLYTAGAQTFIPVPAPLIFVGYGIIAPEYEYNDYRDIDVRNAIVVFLSGEPRSTDSSFFDGMRSTIHSSTSMKQKLALSRGARGSILIVNPNDPSMNDWEEQQRQFGFEEVRLLYTPSENLNVLLHPRLSPVLFRDAKYSFEDIGAFDRKGSMKSFQLTLRASFQGIFREREFLSSNVVGIIEGSDSLLKSTYVLLSAHYDHLGIGSPVNGDSINNGVFDNASGLSALLEIARVGAMLDPKPKRSIMFLFLTGEERGFLGSQFYCLNPVVPLYKTIANVNIDGLSMFEKVRTVIGVGAELSSLGEHLMNAIAPLHLSTEDIPAELFRYDQFRNSDQFIFAQAGIPSILVAEGLHYEVTSYRDGIQRYVSWAESRYHTPLDDVFQSMNFEAAVQHTSILYRFAEYLANTDEAPEWRPESPFLNARLRSIAEQR